MIANRLTHLLEDFISLSLNVFDLCLQDVDLFFILDLHGIEAALGLLQLVHQLLLQIDL